MPTRCSRSTRSSFARTTSSEFGKRRASGGGEFTTYVVQYGFVGDAYEEAWETLRDGYFYQQRKYQEWAEGEEVDELPEEQRRELEERALVGTPENVVDELEEYRDALGEDVHFVFRPYAPGIETEELLECIRRLGEEVAPRL